MEKQITIKIADKGELRGTVGWLLKNADHVKIGETKSGNQGAWLENQNGETMSVLAIRNWWHEDGEIKTIKSCDPSEYDLSPNFSVSPACLERLQELAETVSEIMEEMWNENPECEIELKIKE